VIVLLLGRNWEDEKGKRNFFKGRGRVALKSLRMTVLGEDTAGYVTACTLSVLL